MKIEIQYINNITYLDLFKNVNINPSNKIIFKLNNDYIATKELDIQNKVNGNMFWIQDVDQKTYDTVGPREKIVLFISKYSKEILSLHELTTYYTYWRNIRGDGNCYYRAIIFGIIEKFIKNVEIREQGFTNLIALFSSVKSLGVDHDHLLDLLTNARIGNVWKTIQEFEIDILHENERLDNILILLCRFVVSNYLKANKNKMINGISINDAITGYSDLSIDKYCENIVEIMGTYAEGPLVELGIIPLSLNCSQTIVYVDDNFNVNYFKSNVSKIVIITNIDVLLHNNHYDLIYAN
jgi:ubiquitin thioesterase protein OTUB1